MVVNIPTNKDALLDELKQDVAHDRWRELWERYQFLVLGTIAVIVLATAGHSYWQHVETQKNIAMTEALYTAMGTSKTSPDEAAQGLLAFAEQHKENAAGFMAKIQAAALLLRAGKTTDAMLQYEAALADKDTDSDLRAVTVIKFVQGGFDRLESNQVAEILAPYQQTTSAYRFAALELGALNAYRAGNFVEVQEMLGKILADKDAPVGARTRANDLQRVLVK